MAPPSGGSSAPKPRPRCRRPRRHRRGAGVVDRVADQQALMVRFLRAVHVRARRGHARRRVSTSPTCVGLHRGCSRSCGWASTRSQSISARNWSATSSIDRSCRDSSVKRRRRSGCMRMPSPPSAARAAPNGRRSSTRSGSSPVGWELPLFFTGEACASESSSQPVKRLVAAETMLLNQQHQVSRVLAQFDRL